MLKHFIDLVFLKKTSSLYCMCIYFAFNFFQNKPCIYNSSRIKSKIFNNNYYFRYQRILEKLLRSIKVKYIPFFNLVFLRCILFRTTIKIATIAIRKTMTTNVIVITIPALQNRKEIYFNFTN